MAELWYFKQQTKYRTTELEKELVSSYCPINAQLLILGFLLICDNIAYQGAGGGIYQITNIQIPSDSNDVDCTFNFLFKEFYAGK